MQHARAEALHRARAEQHPDGEKARAHAHRAAYHASFGATPEGLGKLPFNIKWKILTEKGCDRAIHETEGESIETRQGLYDTQLTKEIAAADLFVPARCKLASGLAEQHPNFTYRCSRFFQNCAERDGRFDVRVMNLTDDNIRAVMERHRVAICNGTFYPPIGEWDVRRVTNMRRLFGDWAEFNSPLEKWDTSSVLNMAGMFSGCLIFNQPIGRWDTSRVTKMVCMFKDAVAFNQPIGAWRTGSVWLMSYMFEGAAAFQQDISAWDVSAVTRANEMFFNGTLPARMWPRLTEAQLADEG